MKAILIVETPKKCIDCPLVYKEDHFIYRCKVSEDQVDSNSIYCDCPLRPSSDYIPIEWLKRYEITKGQEVRLQDAINEWEKENETNAEC